MLLLLIIADDFTGALDTGVQFAAYGAATRVMVKDQVDFAFCDAQVLVVDTETRHLPPEKAYQIVEELTRAACRAGIRYIYKKTDSALRGNIGAELAAVLQASNNRQLPFLPAFPQNGRTTRDGIHYVDGVPVTESPFGVDPFEPVRHARITELLAEQTDVSAVSCPPLREGSPVPENAGILVLMLRMNRIWSRPAAVCLPERHRRSWQAARGLQRCFPGCLGWPGSRQRSPGWIQGCWCSAEV